MSALDSAGVEAAIASGRPADLTPIALDASRLDSTAPSALRDLKAGLAAEGYLPAELVAEARFDGEDALAVQDEADRLRDVVRAAAFLGAGRLVVDVVEASRPDHVETALAALDERARREGVAFEVRGPIDD